MARLFGFEFNRIQEQPTDKNLTANAAISFVERDSQDSAALVSASASFGTYVDLNQVIKSEAALISKYREMLIQPEVDNAVDEIVNEAICTDEEFVVKIDLDDVPLDDNAKEILNENFEEILRLLDFKFHAYNIFRRWYVDGRIYYHAVIDQARPDEGIKELRYIDPRKIREIKEIDTQKLPGVVSNQGSIDVPVVKNNYYLYNEQGFGTDTKSQPMQGTNNGGIRIAKDSIIHIPSGITDVNGNMGIGYLHKALKILNQLRTIEDSLIIYRLARSPERRVWYVDVGEMPRIKAEQYVRDLMTNQKNRLIYDADTGNIRDDRKFLTMLEDYWLPTRSDGSGTKVENLEGGKTLGEIEDIVYFQKQLYQSLNVPVDRLNTDAPFMLGQSQEISREEIKFDKFTTRLKQQFSLIFSEALGRNVVLKGLMTIEEWEAIKRDIQFEYAKDNHFADLKDQQIAMQRLQVLELYQPYIGLYYSHKWVRRNVLKQTDEDILQMNMEIAEEMQDPVYQMAAQRQMEMEGGGPQEQGQEESSDDSGGDSKSSGGSASSKDSAKKEKEAEKKDDSKSIIHALKDVKNKTAKEVEELRKAAKTLTNKAK